MTDNPDLRGLFKYQKSGDSVSDMFRKGYHDVQAEVAKLYNVGRTVGFLYEGLDWIESEVERLAETGFAGRLYWDLPPELITTDELITEMDRYRDPGSARTNSDSSVWIPSEEDAGITREQWDGPSRPPAIRLAVERAKEEDPDLEVDSDTILHGLRLPYDEQISLAKICMERFSSAFPKYSIEPLTHKSICSILCSDRMHSVPADDRILSKGFMRVLFGWWHLYGNVDILRCGSVTLSHDWFIMNESAGYPYPSDGFGLSIGVKDL